MGRPLHLQECPTLYDPRHKKRPGPMPVVLYNHRRWLELEMLDLGGRETVLSI